MKFSKTTDKFIPKELHLRGGDELSHARTFVVVWMVVLPILFLFGFTYYHYGVMYVVKCIIASALIVGISMPIFYFTKSALIGVNILLSSGLIILLIASTEVGGMNAPGLFWVTDAVLLSAILYRIRWTIGWSFIYATGILVLGFSKYLSIEIRHELSAEQLAYARMASSLGSLLVMLILISTFLRSQIELKKQIEEKNLELKLSSESNTRLVRMMSHDISNSLTVFAWGMLNIRIKPQDTEKVLIKMQNALENASGLVSHVKEQQAIIAGKKSIELVATNLAELIQKSVELLESQCKTKSIEIQFKQPKDPSIILTEPTSCQNVIINNLLTNAIKFSPKNSKILVQLQENDDYHTMVIQDQGIGMPKDLLEKLFDIGAKTSRTGTAGEVGTGFGMPLLKSYVELFGGQVEVQSKNIADYPSDHGTAFKVHFKKVA